MISVVSHGMLEAHFRSRKGSFEVPYSVGLPIREVIRNEGFPMKEARYLMITINGRIARLDEPLQDGDVVHLRLAIAGG